MSDFFLRLAGRTLGQAATVQPEIASRFATGPMVQRNSQMEIDAAGDSLEPPLDSSRPQPPGRPAAMIQDAAEFAVGDSRSTVARPRVDPEYPLQLAIRHPKEPVQVRPDQEPGQAFSVPPLAPPPDSLPSQRDSGTALQADVTAHQRAALALQAMRPSTSANDPLSTISEPPKPPAPNPIRPIASASTFSSASTAQPHPGAHPAEVESDPTTSGAASGTPIVRITIGRVEVRAIMPVKAERPQSTRSRPRLSLDDFLKQGDRRPR